MRAVTSTEAARADTRVRPPLVIERPALGEQPGEVRHSLQRRAPENFRRHVWRAVTRFSVLIACDAATLLLLHQVVRTLRDAAWSQGPVSAAARLLLPEGYFGPWQFVSALVLGLVVMGTYGPGDRRRDLGRLFSGVALGMGLPLWSGFWSEGLGIGFLQYGLTAVGVWLSIMGERLLVNRTIARVRGPGQKPASVLFVGPHDEVHHVLARSVFGRNGHYHSVGFVDTTDDPSPTALGHVTQFSTCLARTHAEVVVVCGQLSNAHFHDVVDSALAAGCQVLAVARAVHLGGLQPSFQWRDGEAVVQLTTPSLRGQQLVLKRLADVVLAGLGLLVLAPVFAAVAAVVRLDSGGPVFFTQERVGRGGRRFKILKFRTMTNGAEARQAELSKQSVYEDPRLFKVPLDPRATRTGKWLRRTSLDELPQLINVLRGDMSLVGPRPPLPSEVALYQQHHYARFDVKPGMTGPWQVAGRNNIRDFEAVISLETEYIRNWSLNRDFRILLRTVPVVLGRRGAL